MLLCICFVVVLHAMIINCILVCMGAQDALWVHVAAISLTVHSQLQIPAQVWFARLWQLCGNPTFGLPVLVFPRFVLGVCCVWIIYKWPKVNLAMYLQCTFRLLIIGLTKRRLTETCFEIMFVFAMHHNMFALYKWSPAALLGHASIQLSWFHLNNERGFLLNKKPFSI